MPCCRRARPGRESAARILSSVARMASVPSAVEVAGHAAGHDDVAQQPMAECGVRMRAARSRASTLQWACIRVKEASLQMAPMSPRWLASRSSSASSARSQTARSGTTSSERRFGGPRERVGIGDGAVARDASGELDGALELAPVISPSMPLWVYPSRCSSRTTVSPLAVKRKCPGSMIPACTGPTAI